MRENLITIQKIANGWIVTLPYTYKPEHVEMEAQARIIKKRLQPGDEILESIKADTFFDEHHKEVYQLKQDNIFVFYTFEELIQFIAAQTDNKRFTALPKFTKANEQH